MEAFNLRESWNDSRECHLPQNCSRWYYGDLLKKSRNNVQTEMALQLRRKVGVPIDRYLGLNDIKPFQNLLDVSVNVVSSRVGNKFVRVEWRRSEHVYICIT